MADKDPKDMTSSELLRWATNGEPYNGVDGSRWTYPTEKIKALVEDVTGEWPSDHEAFSIIADKIDAELAEARKDAIRESKKPMWWFRNAIKCGYDWPEPRDGEKFRDYLHRCFLPRPRFEDGEPVQFEDNIDELHGVEKFIFTLSRGGSCQMQDADGNMLTVFTGGFVKRHAPEALGADGKPIVVGETVWNRFGTKNTVERLEYSKSGLVKVWYKNGHFDISCTITHTPPDTQQKIDDDATMPPAEYCAVRGIDLGDDPDRATATEAMVLDLLRRQRELDKRTGGAE